MDADYSNYKDLILRDLLNEKIDISNDEKICLWIHDTCDKNLSGYSEGEFGDFLKAAYIAQEIAENFKIEHFEYVEGTEIIGYYKACIMKLYGVVINNESLKKNLNEQAILAINDFSKYPNKEELDEEQLEIWSNFVHQLSHDLWERDLWLDEDCPIPELFKAVKLRQLLYSAFLSSNGVSDEEFDSYIEKYFPDFPKEDYHGGPNISFYIDY